jgi:serine/threonine protein kinase
MQPQPEKPSILIVDDEQLIRRSVGEVLADLNYAVFEAGDGRECLAVLDRETIDIVLMDIQMPKLDGLETFRRMVRDRYRVDTIMMSGHGNIETAVAAIKCGAHDFLEKPFSMARLKMSLDSVMQRRTASQRLLDMKQNGRRIGKFLLEREIAAGGTATLYRAVHEEIGKSAAVKVLHPHLTNNEAFAKRFFREAQICAGLSHPNIVGVFDYGRQDDLYYIVMELIDGASLDRHLDADHCLPVDICAAAAVQVCAGLAHAHARGVVHRDIKPHNVLIALDGLVKLADFGMAWTIENAQLGLTGAGNAAGTPQFMAPEQVRGDAVTPATDIFAMGVLLYLMATLKFPFPGDNIGSIAYQILNGSFYEPADFNPAISPTLNRVIVRCMQKEPQARYQSADELRGGLIACLPAGSDCREMIRRYFMDKGLEGK